MGRAQDREPQAPSNSLHAHRAWMVSSGSNLHCSQRSEVLMWRCAKLAIVGRALLQALHVKCLILFGTLKFHNPFQNFL